MSSSDDEVPGFRLRSGDPFAVAPEDRDPGRRLRGRLASPVTVWTAGRGAQRAGLTVSSLVVAEGEPPSVVGLVGPLTNFWEVASATTRFVVHVLDEDQGRLADRFAGRYPEPPFDRVEATEGDWGPELAEAPTRAFCSVASYEEVGWFLQVTATVDRVDVATGRPPLVHLQGRYWRLQPGR
ncbi:MAG TPA: flavin reductase family protein [Acidimicrobiales bacterium]|nr:flavin reductase family protein [Acidimicrobiales bacterium]